MANLGNYIRLKTGTLFKDAVFPKLKKGGLLKPHYE